MGVVIDYCGRINIFVRVVVFIEYMNVIRLVFKSYCWLWVVFLYGWFDFLIRIEKNKIILKF